MIIVQDKILKDAPHGFFGITGGVSTGDYASLNCSYAQQDTRENVTENRARAVRQLSCKATKLQTMNQVHGTDVVVVDDLFAKAPSADALVTKNPEIVLGVLTADCVPVLLADIENGVIGAAHAGWPSAFGGIVTKTVAVMQQQGAALSKIRAVIGPSIRRESYEIDRDYYNRFLEQSAENAAFFREIAGKPDHFLFDLAGYVLRQTEAAGVTHISDAGGDTCAQPEKFFSYRRHMLRHGHGNCGRQISAIALS